MNDRLASIERMLKQSHGEAHSSTSTTTATRPISPVSSAQWSDNGRPFRVEPMAADPTPAGDTGTQAESMAAKNVLEQTVGHDPDPAVHHDLDLRNALAALRSIVHRAQIDAMGAPTALSSAPSTTLPTFEQVEAVLERLESSSKRLYEEP